MKTFSIEKAGRFTHSHHAEGKKKEREKAWKYPQTSKQRKCDLKQKLSKISTKTSKIQLKNRHTTKRNHCQILECRK